MKKNILTFIFSAGIILSAVAQNNIDTANTQTLRLDLKSSRGSSVSGIFEDVKFIPLETTSQSLFGTISQLEVTDDSYVIYDQDTQHILIFNLDGRFRTKIKLEKIERGHAFEFRLSQESSQACLQVPMEDQVLYFDLNGKLLKKEKPLDNSDGKTRFVFSPEGTAVKTNYEIENSTYEIALVKDGKVNAGFFPHEKGYTRNDQFIGAGKNISCSGNPNEVLYKRYYDYSIYKISPNQVSRAYKLIFPNECSLPVDFMTNKDFINKKVEYLQNNRKVFYGLNNLYEIGQNLFFSVVTLDLSKSNKRDFVYNLRTRSLFALQDLEPDSLSSFLPVTTLSLNPEFFFHGFYLFRNGYLYNSIPSIDLIALKNQNPIKDTKYNSVLTQFFKTQNKKSNPVIVALKPKKD